MSQQENDHDHDHAIPRELADAIADGLQVKAKAVKVNANPAEIIMGALFEAVMGGKFEADEEGRIIRFSEERAEKLLLTLSAAAAIYSSSRFAEIRGEIGRHQSAQDADRDANLQAALGGEIPGVKII